MRRAFLINSTVILLLIPLLLLLATYEDASSQIINSQSERTQVERTFDVVSYLELDFQKAMELSGKRALVAVVDYVATTGNFINPNYMVNNTIRDLILKGTTYSPVGNSPDVQRIMRNQDLKSWMSNVSAMLKKQGYILEPSPAKIANSIELTVSLLDAFHVVIRGRIPNVTIRDLSGNVVYTGPIPRNGYIYSIISIQNLEDPMYSAMTGGRYHRSVRACNYAFPDFTPPFTTANGSGITNYTRVVGLFGKDLQYNSTYIWAPTEGYMTNLTINDSPVTTDRIILNDGDMGVMVFNSTSSGTSGGTGGWCYPSLGYRVNFTISGGSLTNYDGYQIPIVITNSEILGKTYYTGDNASIRIVEKGTCTQVPFWIEYWSSTKAIVWIRATASTEYTLYFGDAPTYATRGNGTSVFEWFHGTEEIIQDGKDKSFDLSSLDLRGSIAIDFRAKPSIPSTNEAWDSGIYVSTTDVNGNPQWIYFIDDTKSLSYSLAIWDVYYVWWWPWPLQGPATNDGARGDTDFHTYEAIIKPNINGAYVNFLDYGVDYTGFPTPVRENLDGYLRHYQPPLKYLYLVNLYNGNKNKAIFKWIFIRKYIQTLPTVTFGGIGEYTPPTTTTQTETAARVYDLQPFINCLRDNRYFAIPGGWSFFERLEGSDQNHNAYVALAHSMQDALGYKYGNSYYPIGLVSFMIPNANYDEKLLNLFNTLGITLDNESSVDYYFLPHYFKKAPKVQGYRVWGISYGTYSGGDLSIIPFYIDERTAEEIFGIYGSKDLTVR
ncbi:DUF2341 domain-containing protein [Thermococcus sp.]|uniref:DUF2341 domain-containing protein n=1 Tax=Thermococcus sp. TaxID=35749 RepID=UPI0026159E2C|nr:DUF2341 domain-containing protein [Thermococcus sp.]